MDIDGQPVAGVQTLISALPAAFPAIVDPPPPTDANGYAVGYISATQSGCVTIEVRTANVVLRQKPEICFQ